MVMVMVIVMVMVVVMVMMMVMVMVIVFEIHQDCDPCLLSILFSTFLCVTNT